MTTTCACTERSQEVAGSIQGQPPPPPSISAPGKGSQGRLPETIARLRGALTLEHAGWCTNTTCTKIHASTRMIARTLHTAARAHIHIPLVNSQANKRVLTHTSRHTEGRPSKHIRNKCTHLHTAHRNTERANFFIELFIPPGMTTGTGTAHPFSDAHSV